MCEDAVWGVGEYFVVRNLEGGRDMGSVCGSAWLYICFLFLH